MSGSRRMTTAQNTASRDDPIDVALDRTAGSERGGSGVLVLLVAAILVGAAAAIVTFGHTNAEPFILAFLAVLATIGVFSLFALACGILRLSSTAAVSPLI